MKVRMVANRNEQDPEFYTDHFSPTVVIHFITNCSAIAAYNGTCFMAEIDVKGAFTQEEMEGPFCIKVDKKLRTLIV